MKTNAAEKHLSHAIRVPIVFLTGLGTGKCACGNAQSNESDSRATCPQKSHTYSYVILITASSPARRSR